MTDNSDRFVVFESRTVSHSQVEALKVSLIPDATWENRIDIFLY